MLQFIIPGLLLLGGGGAAAVAINKNKKAKAVGNKPAEGATVKGMPVAGPGAPVGLTAPGVPQPTTNVVALTPIPDTPQALQDASAKLIQRVTVMGQTPAVPVDEVKQFQTQFNATAPVTPLLIDGLYSGKTQAALQSAITPAIAPQAAGSAVVVALPANPAPDPNLLLANDVAQSSKALYDFLMFSGGNKKGTFREVTTFQTAWNNHHSNPPLIADGQYGGNTENALNSVLTFFKRTEKAPKNPYGAPKTPPPIFVL
jgi:hypothetical protein